MKLKVFDASDNSFFTDNQIIFTLLVGYDTIAQKLIQAGANITAETDDLASPLLLAAQNSKPKKELVCLTKEIS